jgi:hypothetical protein
MSRGIGKIQRTIMAVLMTRPGGDWVRNNKRGEYDPVRFQSGVQLHSDVHDLRLVKKIIWPDKMNWTYSQDASFSRAVRRLHKDGYLEWHRGASYREKRFVSVKAITLALSDIEMAIGKTLNDAHEASVLNDKRRMDAQCRAYAVSSAP